MAVADTQPAEDKQDMSRRTERVGNLIRNIIGEVLLRKLSDPRIDPARTSITRVEVPTDLMTAKVYVSVLSDRPAQQRTIEALQAACGHIQKLIRDEIRLRHTPKLEFLLDMRFKKTLETLTIIQQEMAKIHEKEAAQAEQETNCADGPQKDISNEKRL